jgi:hypothetical protein
MCWIMSLWLISITLLHAGAFSPKSAYQFRREIFSRRHPLAAAPSFTESKSEIKVTSSIKFDISLAIILAGYSFEAYNEPVCESQKSHDRMMVLLRYFESDLDRQTLYTFYF